MKRINLTENDIFNIVNKVIAEQKVNQPKEPLSPDDLKKRFLYGDNKAKVKVPAIKGMTFNINDKRGLRKEMIQFVVEDVEFRDTNSKNGTTALIKGYIKEEGGSKQQLTVFEYVCGRFGDFVLKEYKGLDENDIKKQKTPSLDEVLVYYLLLHCLLFLAFFKPNFLLSLALPSLVRNPSFLSGALNSASNTSSARAIPSLTDSA